MLLASFLRVSRSKQVGITSLYVNLASRFLKKKLKLGAFHVVVAEKKDGQTLFQRLSTATTYKSKFVSSDSTVEEVNQAAMEWSSGKLDVIITTTMGLVGNENPMCRYLVCVGYLYDSMQIAQALGRLRNCMRLPHHD